VGAVVARFEVNFKVTMFNLKWKQDSHQYVI